MKKKILLIGLIIFLLVGGIVGTYFLTKTDDCEKPNTVETDAEKFKKEYANVDADNVFVYRDVEEILTILKHGTGVVYLGFPECPWCGSYVKFLNEVAKEEGVSKIYYYNVLKDRKNNTKEYQEIVKILDKNLQLNEEGKPRLYVPNVSFHIKGKVIGNDYETSLDTHGLKNPADYWTKEAENSLKEKLTKYMKEVANELSKCTDCNK
ncbi:MAG: hypothetical protein RR478_05785 [Bacilli bacterium]